MTRTHERRRTTRILAETLAAQEGEFVTFDALLKPLSKRAFGWVLLLLAIPNLIPAPIGIGGVMGTLIVLLGLQMLVGLEQPWIPARLRRHRLRQSAVRRFLDHALPVLERLERMCRPRLEVLARRPAHLVNGLFLTLIGLLLALPIPFTNYLFGLLMLAYAIALIEHDGALLLGLWIVSGVVLALSLLFSNIVIAAMARMF